VDLYEYQARDMFEAHGVPVLGGEVAVTPEEAFAAAQRVGAKSGGVVVVKAQVKTGGRGKAGGVKVAKSPEEAQALAAQILGMDIKGHTVKKVMIAEGAKIAEEYYFSLLLDRPTAPTWRCAARRAAWTSRPSPSSTPRSWPGSRSTRSSGSTRPRRARSSLRPASTRPTPALVNVLVTLGDVYAGEDATLVEVNPLVKTEDGQIVALDGKVTLDDNADFRHPEHEVLIDHSVTDPLEVLAIEKGSTTSSSTATSASSATVPAW
jgi:succinyl-CoA synthetase beta subunit